MQYAVPLAERINGATTIVEGKIISQTSFPAGKNGMIYTRWTIEVYKVFKGSNSQYTDITTEGGLYGTERVCVSPSVELSIGQIGIFFLQVHTANDDFKGFEPYSWSQCFIRYDEATGIARDIFQTYSTAVLYNALSLQVGSAARPIKEYSFQRKQVENNKTAQPLSAKITSIFPTTTSAGTNNIITITGLGFGNSYSGQAAIAFKNADDGGATIFSATAAHIVSWVDDEIKVRVPAKAGTGTIRVTAIDGSQATSIDIVYINYALINVDDEYGVPQRPYLINANDKGGYTLTLNNSFTTNSLAMEAFNIALRTWRCNTFVNIGVTESPTSLNCKNGTDGINVISFDDNCTLPAGVISLTYHFYTMCNTTYWRLREFDVIFSANAGGNQWNYGLLATIGNRIDFQSVVLHELGHVHQLGHTINSGGVMHFTTPSNTNIRSLALNREIAAGNDVMNRSIVNMPCGPKGITKLTASICDNPGVPPNAAFTAAPLKGCVPLTVSFTDQSTDSATLWNWDFKNNDADHFYTQNPTFTYTTPGTYSVKFTASNALGSHSIVKTAYITVLPAPTVDVGKNRNVCVGTKATLGGAPTAKGNPPFTYQWSPANDLDNPTAANPIVTVVSVAAVDYSVTVTDANGCSATKSVTIAPVPMPIINAGSDKSVCNGDKGVTIGGSPTATGGTPPYKFSWTPTTGLDMPTSPNPTATPTITTDYILTVTDDNNACQLRDTVRVTVSAATVKPIITRNLDTLFSTPAATYLWKRDSFTLPLETKQFIVTTTPGKYTVTTTDATLCASTSDEFTIPSNAVSEPVELAEILMYPNPTDGNIEIQLPFAGANCRVSTVLGMVRSEQVIIGKQATIVLANFPSGIYFLELTAENKRYIRMITKE
jgi:PKD repeat protein